MRKIPYKEFIEGWENDIILEVEATANTLYGKSVKGQADKPKRYELVYCIEKTELTKEKSLWSKLKDALTP